MCCIGKKYGDTGGGLWARGFARVTFDHAGQHRALTWNVAAHDLKVDADTTANNDPVTIGSWVRVRPNLPWGPVRGWADGVRGDSVGLVKTQKGQIIQVAFAMQQNFLAYLDRYFTCYSLCHAPIDFYTAISVQSTGTPRSFDFYTKVTGTMRASNRYTEELEVVDCQEIIMTKSLGSAH